MSKPTIELKEFEGNSCQVIQSWNQKTYELHQIKLFPSGSKPTRFIIIGRTNEKQKYSKFGKSQESFHRANFDYWDVIRKVIKKYKLKALRHSDAPSTQQKLTGEI